MYVTEGKTLGIKLRNAKKFPFFLTACVPIFFSESREQIFQNRQVTQRVLLKNAPRSSS